MSIPVLPGATPLLVGREQEQAVLRNHLAAARAGRGGLVLIGGQAGIGKTALAEALCHEAAEHGAIVLSGRCYDLTETPPYGPWLDLFGRYQPTDTLPLRPAAFAERGMVGAVASQVALFNQVQDFLASVVARHPLLLLLDDLHWADPASLDLLRVLARSLAPHAVLLVVAYRSDELSMRHPLATLLPLLVHEADAVRLNLRSLDDDAIQRLVKTRYQLAASDEARLVSYLLKHAEGNCFFTMELLRTLEEERVLDRAAGNWRIGDLTAVQMPMLVLQVINGRLARLGRDAQHLLTLAAIIGHEVPLTLWMTVASVEEETLLAVVERATEAHLIEETPDGARVRFVHALVRAALYEGVAPSQRRRMHQQIGEALVASPAPDPDALAYHFRHAGDVRAVEWLVKAGDRAERAYAWLTAAERFATAIALLPASTLGVEERGSLLIRHAWLRRWADPEGGIASLDEAIRLAADADDAVLAVCARYYRGILHCRSQDFRRGLVDLKASIAALGTLPVHDGERVQVFYPLTTSRSDLSHSGNLAMWLAYAGRYAEAQAIGERIVAAEARGRVAPSEASHGLALVYAARGQPAAARRAFAHARSITVASGNHAGAGHIALQELEWVRLPYYTDQVRERQVLAAEAVAAWTQASGVLYGDDPPALAYLPLMMLEGGWDEVQQLGLTAYGAQNRTVRRFLAARMLGIVACNRGESDRAWSLIEEWLPAADTIQPGDVRFLDTLVLQRLAAALALDAGDLSTAREWLARHDTWLAWNGTVLGQAEGALGWAAYHRLEGNLALAYERANQALRDAGDPRQPLALLAAHRLLGELDTGAGRFEAAQQHLTASLALADACAAPYERALTLLAFAGLHAARGDREEAFAALVAVRAICAPLGAQPILHHADALATRLAMMQDASPANPAGLSAREAEILLLLAAGRTNQNIADTLFLSVHTVRVHVRSILTKTQTDNRTAAAAFARQHGLV